MYERFYGLRELPFELTPNPQYLFLTARHRSVLCNLQYGITSRRGITVLVGEAGTGKTTLVHTALGLMERDDARCVYLNNPTLTRTEFVAFLAHGFGLSEEAGQSKTVFLRDLERVLHARLAEGVVSALLIDEAQSLPHELLEETRLLANMETTTDKLLPVVLAGQPELGDRLNEPSLRQLKQRVALRCELLPLELHETASYIAARIARAGGKSAEIFTREAVEAIHGLARGIPRTVSVICDNALIGGFAADRRPVDRNLVLEVSRDLDLGGDPETIGQQRPDAHPLATPAPHTTADSPPADTKAEQTSRSKMNTASIAGRLMNTFERRRRFSFF